MHGWMRVRAAFSDDERRRCARFGAWRAPCPLNHRRSGDSRREERSIDTSSTRERPERLQSVLIPAPAGVRDALPSARHRGRRGGCHEKGIVHRDLKPANSRSRTMARQGARFRAGERWLSKPGTSNADHERRLAWNELWGRPRDRRLLRPSGTRRRLSEAPSGSPLYSWPAHRRRCRRTRGSFHRPR